MSEIILGAADALSTTHDGLTTLITLVTDGVDSPETKRAYRRSLTDFVAWFSQSSYRKLNKASVQAYRRDLIDAGKSPANINLRLSAIRKLALEAADNELMDDRTAAAIRRVRGIKNEGVKMGLWLSLEQAQKLINAPDTSTLIGLRDRALLAVLIGCGLRRTEVTILTFSHLVRRAGRWCFVDLKGKRGKYRTVPVPAWVKQAIDAYVAFTEPTGYLFKRCDRWGNTWPGQLSSDSIRAIVTKYRNQIEEPTLAPHDLRRTFARLMYDNDQKLSQISKLLGHSSIKVTERYLGLGLEIENAANDSIQISLL